MRALGSKTGGRRCFREDAINGETTNVSNVFGRMAEWFKAAVLKTSLPARLILSLEQDSGDRSMHYRGP
jgi:hypothetical protein